MFLNLTNIPEIETMAALAEGFFNAKCPKYSDNNYEKYVVVNTNTRKCSFQRGDYIVKFGDVFFKCVREDGRTLVTLNSYQLDETKPRRTFINYDGKHHILNDGNCTDADTGFEGEYVDDIYDLGWHKVVRGRIINIYDLVDAGSYNEEAIKDAYQAMGDFSKLIDSLQCCKYPVYIRISFCEDCDYLFQYQHFSLIDNEKFYINYRFLGIISEEVTREDIEQERTLVKNNSMGLLEYTPFLLPYEVPYLTGTLHEAIEDFEHFFDIEEYEKYNIDTSFIMNRFSPRLVVKTTCGIFHVVYDRVSDNAFLYYSSDASISMERIEGYGGFPAAFGVIKEKLKELSQVE